MGKSPHVCLNEDDYDYFIGGIFGGLRLVPISTHNISIVCLRKTINKTVCWLHHHELSNEMAVAVAFDKFDKICSHLTLSLIHI